QPTAAKHHFAAGNPQNVQAPGWLNSMDPPIGLRRVALKSRYPASQRRRGYKAARGLDLIKSRLDVWAKLHQLVVPGIPRIDGGQVQLGQIAPSDSLVATLRQEEMALPRVKTHRPIDQHATV